MPRAPHLGHLVLSALVTLSALAPVPGEAQPSTGEAVTRPGQHRIHGEVDFYQSGIYSFAFMAPALYGRFRLHDARHGLAVDTGEGGFVVDLDLAWRGAGMAGDVAEFRMGNPFVGLRLGTDGAAFTARGGLGVTLPFMNVYDDSGTDAPILYTVAPTSHGAWDLELMFPESMAVMLTGDAQFRSAVFSLGGDAAVSTLFHVAGDGSSSDPILALKLGVYGALMPIPQLAIGLRFQMVMALTQGLLAPRDGEEGFLALAPFVRAHLGPAFAEVRLWMNLDDPYGFAFDEAKYWSLALSGGLAF